ncbi:sacsin-like isoform X3 [Montipora foliosa]|uniref:sacsin-like isoform X3 n=1 Tax=Montipora foliosa TaxID=591990 RepID=UPI0035F146A1
MAQKEGRRFGLIKPTLIQQLRKILDEYPDDGQILKELIQNADDANATQLKFLHDRHNYPTENLYADSLAEFQGPALYAYNNAVFTENDWDGIQRISDSVKAADPLKVGRFGLGFKSVFHMTECTQLRLLSKEDVARLIHQALPHDWENGGRVSWYPDDDSHDHPSRDWINLLWRYLAKHFPSAKDLQLFKDIPLIPLSLSQTPVTLTRLCYPSPILLKDVMNVSVNATMAKALQKLGLIVLPSCPTSLSHHPAIAEFLNPPTVEGVLKAMVVSSSTMVEEVFSKTVKTNLSSKEKQLLRTFFAKVRPSVLTREQCTLLKSLPIFETIFQEFVSMKDGLHAAPLQPLPIPSFQDLIDISQEDSKSFALLLKVRILKPTELLREIIFPDVKKGKYSSEQIDQLICYVQEQFADFIKTDPLFKSSMQELPFVEKKRQRVTASKVFDPRNKVLQRIFAHEDIFPVGEIYHSPAILLMLEDLGMKGEQHITARDILRTARIVSKVTSLSIAKQKSEAILTYLLSNPKKLLELVDGQQLGTFLSEIVWVSRLEQKTPQFPPSLRWWTEDEGRQKKYFFKPTELKSHCQASVIGTVKPVVKVDPRSEICRYFGWQSKPEVVTVIQHLQNVIASYSKDEKAYYIFVVNEIYSFLSGKNPDAVKRALNGVKIVAWIWNGDGFSSPDNVLLYKPTIDLTPYILFLPSEMKSHEGLFQLFGMKKTSDPTVLLQVLRMMKEKYGDGNIKHSPADVRRDIQLSVDILNDVANAELPDVVMANVLLPTYGKDNSSVRLEPVEHCMYGEHDEWLRVEDNGNEHECLFVHPFVPNKTAQLLGVPSKTHRLLNPDELSIGEEFGQEERLTTRLNRLLEDYTDGFAVVKELIQNADDAGATVVKFLYDKRTNDDALTCLFSEGMSGCQGPALWVYNDAKFKDDDFVNITKLNEATKVQETEKIGRFGLGFNAVYNLTDVPMFTSRNYFVIFDPHTTYLGHAIKNKRKPGIKIDLNKDVNNLRRFRNQFKPFHGIFGCDLSLDKDKSSFDGTLFRFPLRTREQALRSEIKELCYNDEEMWKLLEMFHTRAKSLLLFTQNVFRLEVYRNSGLSNQVSQPELMFEVTKSILEGGIVTELSVPVTLPDNAVALDAHQKTLLKNCNFLQASSKVTRAFRTHGVHPSQFPESSIVFSVEGILTDAGLEYFSLGDESRTQCEFWHVVSAMGDGKALQFSMNDPSLVPSGGVAVQLEPKEPDVFIPLSVSRSGDGKKPSSSIFCYLPLPIQSGLAVHINGPFAVTSNRRYLPEKLEDDKSCYGAEWNDALMQDCIVAAFFKLLEDVKQNIPDHGSYVYHSLWPRACNVHQHCWPFLISFYKQLAMGGHVLFSDELAWADITRVVFLHPSLRMNRQIGDVSFAVLKHLANVNYLVVDLPSEVFQSFLGCHLWAEIKDKTFDENRFFREIFFPNILKVPTNLRNELVLYALKLNRDDFHELIKNHACIPVSSNEKVLKCPAQLVHPCSEASCLYCHDDARFPGGKEDTFLSPLILGRLEKLGMKSNNLPWDDIAERAESIHKLYIANRKVAIKRVKALLDFTERKLKFSEDNPPYAVLIRLLDAPFLPILQKPESFPLTWNGDVVHGESRAMIAPKEVYLKERKYLVCCTEPLVDLDMPKRVRKLFKLEQKEVTLEHVTTQLKEAMSISMNKLDHSAFKEVSQVCRRVYSFLQENTNERTSSIEQFLFQRKFVLMEKDRQFVSAEHVAFEVNTDWSPYLFKLPEDLADCFSSIMKFSGVREKFEAKDYICGLATVKQQFGEKQLDKNTLQAATNMANELAALLHPSASALKAPEQWGLIYLPDSKSVMRDVTDLCLKDYPWMPEDPGEHFLHEKIPWNNGEKLGVKTRRDAALEHHDIGLPFGQNEKLTDRLKRILTGYPGGIEILKELVQNADDAQASEISFIKDPRHHPEKRVFKESWKTLQGPALCVYNNKPFTKADIEGICNLGKGGKGNDPNKTGQYGVGFNAVYHLTDVPSFMSMGSEIGDVLCVFDPNCKYIPHSSESRPGRMFHDIENLRKKFPDVFPCYLEDHFPAKNATMFRFPLRSEKMAQESKISQTSVTVEKLDQMMNALKEELFDVLLFVNNVRKIAIAALDDCGKLVVNYSVRAIMSPSDELKREELSCYIKEIGNAVKQRKILPTEVEVKKRTYILQLLDSDARMEKWLIVQQIGFEKPTPKEITDAFQENKLRMLPRGGVACLLESTPARKRAKKAYCFLPLPLRTKLPVHVNGHFALGHETRRNLWRDEGRGYRSDWNNALLQDVIASCYLNLLDEVRGLIQLPVNKDPAYFPINCSQNVILTKLRFYEELFPKYPFEDAEWKTLTDAVYQEMDRKKMRVIPVVRSLQPRFCSNPDESKRDFTVEIQWFPPTGSGKDQAYFNDLHLKGYFASMNPRPLEPTKSRNQTDEVTLKRKLAFVEILLKSGFNLVAFSLNVFQSFKGAGIDVCCVSPSVVMDFYKSFSDNEPLCRIGKIPGHVKNTNFSNLEGVILVLRYCKDDEHFLEKLSGLPLLLTQELILQSFNERQPICLSQYYDLLPFSKFLFVHATMRSGILRDNAITNVAVFRPFDVDVFASQLHCTLDPRFNSEHQFAKWCPYDQISSLPSRRWVCRVWTFLEDFVSQASKREEESEEGEVPCSLDLLSALSHWCLLPATETSQCLTSSTTISEKQTSVTNHFLVPLKKAESVIDFEECGDSEREMVCALRNLGLPELNSSVLTQHCKLAQKLVASVRSPHSLLVALDHKLEGAFSSLEDKLESSDAMVVLRYFDRNTGVLTETDKEILRKLPFYPRKSGGVGKLERKRAFVIPCEFPVVELLTVEASLDCWFLESDKRLSDLYHFLQEATLSSVEVYINFVLKCLVHFSFEGILAHLQHIRDNVSRTASEDEQERLLNCLKTVKCVPAADGSLKTASSFYDPENEVFIAMLPDKSFPPKPFDSPDWLLFLRKIGLVQDVSESDFLDFAREVEREAETAPSDSTRWKSEVLVYHLISRPNVVGEGLLPLVRDIAFVATNPVNEQLRKLCPPFNDARNPFISFKGSVVSDHENVVWTEAHLLPNWADPRRNQSRLGCPHQGELENYLENFLASLQVVTNPPVDLVVSHCQTVCYYLRGNYSEREVIQRGSSSIVTEVMESIYSFLQKNALSKSNVKRHLEKTHCVLVERGQKLILPKQAVLQLYEQLEIKPFLYGVPSYFGRFHELFEFLGCSKDVSPIHYAMVLEMLQRNSRSENLNADEVNKCATAVKGFFNSLHEDTKDLCTLSKLYLPSMPARGDLRNSNLSIIPVSLQESTNLLFDDVPAFGHRIQRLTLPFVLELSLMEVKCKSATDNYKDLMMKLPRPLQPKMLSEAVKEKLSYPQDTVIVSSEMVNKLKQQLWSVQFDCGIARLIKDANSQDKNFDKEVISGIKDSLRNIQLLPVKNLSTSLFHNGVLIPESQSKVPCFKETKKEFDGNVYKVYIQATAEGHVKRSSSALIAKVIIEIYGKYLGRNGFLVSEMLRCPAAEIWSLLDEMNIRKDDSYNETEMGISPEPGTLIPIVEHHMLRNAFEEFDPGDYVGFQLHDPSLDLMEGTATYIYAIIIEEVTDEDVRLWSKMYMINIGHDKKPVAANASRLFKFCRLHEIFDSKSGCHRNKQEVLHEISNILEDAWQGGFSDEERLQILKRLCLRWHPEKNEENEEFYSDVFQHIQREVSRLGGSYEEFFATWGERARDHGSQRKEYKSTFCHHFGSWESPSSQRSWRGRPPSFCSRNPQPQEAKRWIRQARADLEAAVNELALTIPSSEWVCFKCHQAAEKAIKAARFEKGAEKVNVHNLVENCSDLADTELTDLARQLENLVGDSTRMRYPDRMSYPRIPNDVYSRSMANKAQEIAARTVTHVEGKLEML